MNLTARKPMTFEDFYRELEFFFDAAEREKLGEVYDCIEHYPESKKQLVIDLIKMNPVAYLTYAIGKNEL